MLGEFMFMEHFSETVTTVVFGFSHFVWRLVKSKNNAKCDDKCKNKSNVNRI